MFSLIHESTNIQNFVAKYHDFQIFIGCCLKINNNFVVFQIHEFVKLCHELNEPKINPISNVTGIFKKKDYILSTYMFESPSGKC